MLIDGLSVTRHPDAHGVMLVDLEATERFRNERSAATGVPLTLLDLFIRAAALTFGRDAEINATPHKYRLLANPNADIGVSVSTTTNVAPVVVIRSAQELSLEEIHHKRTQLMKDAAQGEAQRQKVLARYARMLPWSPLRRLTVSALINSPAFRRENVGSLQITTIDLPDMEYFLPDHMATGMLISVGGVKKRPMVIGDKVEARLSAYIVLIIDQRVVRPVHGMRLFHRFRALLQKPERLVEKPPTS
jgi:pyruvate/2-oxoglutarate dehydrogenase complex dihydrolipoamide acyltransferase (E2) component